MKDPLMKKKHCSVYKRCLSAIMKRKSIATTCHRSILLLIAISAVSHSTYYVSIDLVMQNVYILEIFSVNIIIIPDSPCVLVLVAMVSLIEPGLVVVDVEVGLGIAPL